jgi:hypothetical protein
MELSPPRSCHYMYIAGKCCSQKCSWNRPLSGKRKYPKMSPSPQGDNYPITFNSIHWASNFIILLQLIDLFLYLLHTHFSTLAKVPCLARSLCTDVLETFCEVTPTVFPFRRTRSSVAVSPVRNPIVYFGCGRTSYRPLVPPSESWEVLYSSVPFAQIDDCVTTWSRWKNLG